MTRTTSSTERAAARLAANPYSADGMVFKFCAIDALLAEPGVLGARWRVAGKKESSLFATPEQLAAAVGGLHDVANPARSVFVGSTVIGSLTVSRERVKVAHPVVGFARPESGTSRARSECGLDYVRRSGHQYRFAVTLQGMAMQQRSPVLGRSEANQPINL